MVRLVVDLVCGRVIVSVCVLVVFVGMVMVLLFCYKVVVLLGERLVICVLVCVLRGFSLKIDMF